MNSAGLMVNYLSFISVEVPAQLQRELTDEGWKEQVRDNDVCP